MNTLKLKKRELNNIRLIYLQIIIIIKYEKLT